MVKMTNNAGKIILVTESAYKALYKHRKGFTLYDDSVQSDEPINDSENEDTEETELVDDNKTEEKTDVTSLSWGDLRKLAADKGINTKGMKRKQIENEINKVSDE